MIAHGRYADAALIAAMFLICAVVVVLFPLLAQREKNEREQSRREHEPIEPSAPRPLRHAQHTGKKWKP